MAIYGSTVVVGAPATNSYTGAAYVFVRSNGTGSQQAELTASDAAPDVSFGYSVAIYGLTAIVGEPSIERGLGGAAYVFVRSGSTWSQQAELTPSDSAYGDEFGWSVAIHGTTAVVGADQAAGAAGAAYVFVRSSGTWPQRAKLTAPDPAANDSFGYSVAIYGSTAVIGAPGENSNTGAAYVFVHSPGTGWSRQATLTASDGGEVGYSVALYGSTAVVSAPVNMGAGTAYEFVQSGTAWTQQAELTASDGALSDYFGWSVAIYQSTAIAGAIGVDSWTGAAYVFSGV